MTNFYELVACTVRPGYTKFTTKRFRKSTAKVAEKMFIKIYETKRNHIEKPKTENSRKEKTIQTFLLPTAYKTHLETRRQNKQRSRRGNTNILWWLNSVAGWPSTNVVRVTRGTIYQDGAGSGNYVCCLCVQLPAATRLTMQISNIAGKIPSDRRFNCWTGLICHCREQEVRSAPTAPPGRQR